jgi:hypothetical protein
MKPRLTVLTILTTTMLSTGILACGNTSRNTAAQDTSNAAAANPTENANSSTTHKNDRDNDNDNNDDDQHVLAFGHIADTVNNQAITTLLNHYYTAAAAENGAKACTLLTPFIAETVVEVDGNAPALKGKTCAAVMTKLFKNQHRDLVEKNANLKIIRIGIEGDRSLVALEFPEVPEVRQITVRYNHNKWTVLHLLDGIIE